jgi:hypothetical protein
MLTFYKNKNKGKICRNFKKINHVLEEKGKHSKNVFNDYKIIKLKSII